MAREVDVDGTARRFVAGLRAAPRNLIKLKLLVERNKEAKTAGNAAIRRIVPRLTEAVLPSGRRSETVLL